MSFLQLILLFTNCWYLVQSWELSLLHVNDIHVRMEETNKYSSPCRDTDKKAGKCYGGIARISAAVENLRRQEHNLIWLNAGDFFQGTLWYTHFKWEPVVQFNNLLKFDAMTLGNHEFDDGMEGLLPFLQNTTCPVVVSNMDLSKVPNVPTNIFVNSTVLDRDGRRIGIVGYLTPDTIFTANPPPELELTDEVEAVRNEVKKLEEEGVDIIIALGHSGYKIDLEIAEKVPGVDVVVGAHSHSFLFTESDTVKNPSNNIIEGDYPTVVTTSQGNKVLVVQAYAFTKYLGHIKINFTSDGLVENWVGMPILLDHTFSKDPEVEGFLTPWQEQLQLFQNKIIGSLEVDLVRSGHHRGRSEETNIGNFIADAMVWAYRDKRTSNKKPFKLGLVNSGGIRTDMAAGNVSMSQVLMVLPYESTLDSLVLQGKYIRETLERSVDDFDPVTGFNTEGQFLQVSGFKITYDVSKEKGSRVVDVMVLCSSTSATAPINTFCPLKENEMYGIVTTAFLARGGDGMTALKENKQEHSIGLLDSEVLEHYIQTGKYEAAKEGRINIITSGKNRIEVTSIVPTFFATIFCFFFGGENC